MANKEFVEACRKALDDFKHGRITREQFYTEAVPYLQEVAQKICGTEDADGLKWKRDLIKRLKEEEMRKQGVSDE